MDKTSAPPRPIQQGINRLAHCRALMYEIQARLRIREEIRGLVSSGMSHGDALEYLYENPPILDPNY